jgi:hypothetical protein
MNHFWFRIWSSGRFSFEHGNEFLGSIRMGNTVITELQKDRGSWLVDWLVVQLVS